MYRQVLALALLAASAMPASAQVKMQWASSNSDTGATLTFGVPETDESIISFTCDKGKEMVLVSSYIGSKGLKADDSARIILTAGKVKKELAGKAVANEENGAVDVEAGAKMGDVKALLGTGKMLGIETKGVKQQVVLTGAPEAFGAFEAACKAN
ncbi:hypothetical protein V5F77_05545 [Xanthobacter sp. DSM 24535]|uniref:hypothetical protein n=1 Tax=Roseixanthobacter psychrophilus TaxID=3119917 RepID=UPI003726D9BB